VVNNHHQKLVLVGITQRLKDVKNLYKSLLKYITYFLLKISHLRNKNNKKSQCKVFMGIE